MLEVLDEVELSGGRVFEVTAGGIILRKALKDAGVSGLSGVKKAELIGLAREHLSPAQFEDAVPVRSYKLTTSGRALLDTHPEVVARYLKRG